MGPLRSIVATTLLAFALTNVPAQSGRTPQPAPSPQDQDKRTSDQKKSGDETIRIDTDLVMLNATVINDRGRFVANLKRNDFSVYEDGVEQQIEYFNTGDSELISLGIVFDTSGSMIDKLDGVRDAVEHFVKAVAPGDEIFLIRFSSDAELAQDFTDDKRRILSAVDRLRPFGSTALYDAIAMGLERAGEGKHRKRALMLLTDGNDTSSGIKLNDAAELARKSEVIVYALGIGHGERGSFGHGGGHDGGIFGRRNRDTVDMDVLRTFAEATGGEAFLLEDAHRGGRDLIDEAVLQVADELKRQYTLGYYPTNTRKDGSFRKIKVELTDKSMRVRTKRGYYARD